MLNSSNFCCEDMRRNLEYRCIKHGDNIWDCPDNLICYSDSFDEFGIIIHDGGTSYIRILFCPFCGKKLPTSKRDLFFKILENLKLEWDDEKLPPEFKTDEWWKKRGL